MMTSFDASHAPEAVAGTAAATAGPNAGEAEEPSETVSPDVPTVSTEETIEALLCVRLEQLAKAREAYATVNQIDRAINRIVRESNLKLPYRSEYGYGMVRKGYEADRYPNPRKYLLRARRTLIGSKKPTVVKASAA